MQYANAITLELKEENKRTMGLYRYNGYQIKNEIIKKSNNSDN